MTEKRTTRGAGPRSKRAAPTIDLTATEVPAVSAGGDPLASAPEPPLVAPVSEPAAAASAGKAPPPNEPPSEPPSGTASPGPSDARPDSQPDSIARLRSHLNAPLLAAGCAGAAVMTVLLMGLWLTGLVPIRYSGSTATRARVTALEMEVHALQNRPSTAADTKAQDGLAALAARVTAMQEAIAKIPAGAAGNDTANDKELAERVAAADSALKSLGVALTAVTRRSDDIATNAAQARERAEAAEKAVTELRSSVQIATAAAAGLSSADLDALQKRIASLEQATNAVRDDIAKTGASDAAARLALSAAALRDAVMSGAPFAPSLAQAKSLGADANLATALEPFAASGVPASAALAQELRVLLPAMIKTTETTASGGFLEKLQANASNLVRVRPVGAPAGDDSAAVLARLESAAANADIDGALADIAKLPESGRQQAADWVTRAWARQKALAAVRTLVTETARSLGSK